MAKKKKKSEETEVAEVKSTALTEVRKYLTKFKGGKLNHIVEYSPSMLAEPWPSIPIGNIKIEYVIGGPYDENGLNRCGGFPRKAVSQVYGKEHCGKTSLCLHAAAHVAAAGGTCMYIDYENILDMRYARHLGVPVGTDSFMLVQPDTLEEGVATAKAAIKMGVDLIVFDSVGAAIPQSQNVTEDEIAQGKNGSLGQVARAWSLLLPVLQADLKNHNAALVGISQTRAAMNSMKPSVQGGNAWKFAAALRVSMKPVGSTKGKIYDSTSNKTVEVKASRTIRVTIDKNKISGTSHWETEVEVIPFRGFDPLTAAVDVLLAHKVIRQSGAWYSMDRNGEELRFQGKANMMDALRQIPGILDELNRLAKPLLKDQSDIVPDFVEVDEDLDMSMILDDDD